MKITELFESLDSKIEYDVVKSTSTTFKTKLVVNEKTIIFESSLTDDLNNHWEISFYELNGKNITYKQTGKGDELKIFSFIKSSVVELIQRYNPNGIIFTSAKQDKSRSNLYQRMITKYSKQYGYVISDIENVTDSDHFTLIKK